jgi:hypothetical protein
LLLYAALQGYAAAAQLAMPMMDPAACAEHRQGPHQHRMADCFAQCQLCGALPLAPGFSKPSAPAPEDLTGPRTAIIAATYDGASLLPHRARGPPLIA